MLTLAILAAVSALLALHPFTTYPLSLRALASLRPVGLHPTQPIGRLAVCVCAYNEAPVIAARVENLLALRSIFPDIDLLFYVDAATDGTADILRAYGGRIRTVVATERHGKTHGMNTLVAMTDADILIFSDANVIFADDAVPRLVAPFADPAVGCACGHLRYRDAADATAATGSLYWRLEEHIKALESATGSVIGADGSIFAIRRSLHVAPPPDLIDDMFVSLSILCRGARIVRVADAIAYEDAVSRPAEEYRRKIRIACQAFNVHRALQASLGRLGAIDRYKYLSHKCLRWLSIYFVATAVVCGLAALVAGGCQVAALALAGAFAASACAVAFAGRGPLGKIHTIAAALLATGIGVARSLQGQRFQTWSPPASARRPAVLAGSSAGD